MRYPALLVADTHLTDNPRDEYRWSLFPWIVKTCKEEKVKTIIFLGDLTDRKDCHSAALTNRVVQAIRSVSTEGRVVKILVGNHDWLLGGQEYFRFLSLIPGVEYITTPREDQDTGGVPTFYLPFSKNPAADWKDFDFSHYSLVFMHQTIHGAVSSNGEKMEGDRLPDLGEPDKVWSGDIHVPQVIGDVEYVGSPYHVHFGDRFTPRCVLLEHGGRPVDLHLDTISRITLKVSSVEELYRRRDELKAHDQVKLRMELTQAEKHEWSKLRRRCTNWLQEQSVEVHGVELVLKKSTRRTINEEWKGAWSRLPADVALRFVESEELGGEAYDVAMEIIEQ